MTAITDPTQIRALVDTFVGWYHQIELPGGIITPGTNHSRETLAQLDALGLPQDCTGLRVLDISCRDGFFSFEMEKRGAEVTGIDYVQPENTGFPIVSNILGSQATYHVENIYNLSPDVYGTFDIVLFLGLLYHLRNPMLAIDRVRSVTKLGGRVFVESHVIDYFVTLSNGHSVRLTDVAPILEDVPLIQFYPGDFLLGDHTNKVGPNMAALKALFYEGQFEVQQTAISGNRGFLVGTAVHDEAREYSRLVDQGIESPASLVSADSTRRAVEVSISSSDMDGKFWKQSETSIAVAAALDLQGRQWQEERQYLTETLKQAQTYAESLQSSMEDREVYAQSLKAALDERETYLQSLKAALQSREQELISTQQTLASIIAAKDVELAAVHQVLDETRTAAASQRDSLMEILTARETELASTHKAIEELQAELQTIKSTLAYKADQSLRRLLPR